VIEHIDAIPEQLHLLQIMNISQESGTPLLMTSRLPPAQLPFNLPDLTSRLKGMVSLELLPPDDALLTMLLLKLCHDQQLTLSAPLIDYIIPRVQRTYSFIQALVDQLRQLSLSAKRHPTIPMAKEALERMGGTGE
jgi:chromosomal replication initiation ATPase DnaA